MIAYQEVGMLDGKHVHEITIQNGGITVSVFSYGCTIHKIMTPDRFGALADVVLGFDDFESYLGRQPYFGALIGRCANRIADGKFSLGGKEYQLSCKNGGHCHGGDSGFDKKIWAFEADGENAVVFSYVSPDGDEGYPGTLTLTVRYEVTADGVLRTFYEAHTDADTLCNLTNHTYFNLGSGETVLSHVLQSPADSFCPADEKTLPTGEIRRVEGTAFDFRKAHSMKQALSIEDEQLRIADDGFDHHFFVSGEGLREMATLSEPTSGRCVTISSDLPGFQLYTAQGFHRQGKKFYGSYCGAAIETQYAPNAIHVPGFESPIVKAGQTMRTETDFAFSVLK